MDRLTAGGDRAAAVILLALAGLYFLATLDLPVKRLEEALAGGEDLALGVEDQQVAVEPAEERLKERALGEDVDHLVQLVRLGALLGGLLVEYGYQLLFWGDVATTVAFGLVVLVAIRETAPAVASGDGASPRRNASVAGVASVQVMAQASA